MNEMKKILTHKGFTGSVEREDDGSLIGHVHGTKCTVNCYAKDEAELETEFRNIVERYIARYEKEGANIKSEITYKGFIGSVELEYDGTLCGEVQGIGSLVMYEGVDMADLEKRFHESVDCYLEAAEEGGWDPYSASHVKEYINKPPAATAPRSGMR